MALVEIDSWQTEYEACSRLNQTIRTQLAQRNKRQRLSPEYNQLINSIQVGLNQFATELKQLNDKLETSAKSNSIDSAEATQRRAHVNELQSQLNQLKIEYNKSVTFNEPERRALLGASSSTVGIAAPLVNDPNLNSNDVDILKQRQIDILESQNQGLEALSQSISRQRALASQLGQEVEGQHDILDNLANTMERVDARVNVETGNISHVNRQDSTWGYWSVIIILFIVNIVVGFIL